MGDRRHEFDPLTALRQRLIHETEIALWYGLRFPERHARIPTVAVEGGNFNPGFAAEWWAGTLGLEEAGFTTRDHGSRNAHP